MKSRFYLALFPVVCSLAFFSCSKTEFQQSKNANLPNSRNVNQRNAGLFMSTATSGCVDDIDNGTGYDTIPKPTILGYHLLNHPYSLTNMQQAYNNLYGGTNNISVTHKYLRFKPSSPEQLSLLSQQDIDLFDYPLDYDVVQHGDFYNDGVTPIEEIPWLYAVTDINFSIPAGITYEVLEQIHVPVLAGVENEAFRITGNPVDNNDCGTSTAVAPLTQSKDVQPNVAEDCQAGFHWDFLLRRCVPDGPPDPDPVRVPSGGITVFDNTFNTNQFLRNARIVAKRFLKVERTFTDNQGRFNLSKEFNKVHILLKFENDQAIVRSVRRVRLWQMLFPVERNLGRFSGSVNNLEHNIPYNADARSDGARDWAAATAHNNVQEYRESAAQQNVGVPPNKLRILLTNWRLQGVSGAAPMFAKRVWQTIPSAFLTTFLIGNVSTVALISILKSEIDITAGYNLGSNDVTAEAEMISEVLFHEQTHAAHYNKVGNVWWADFVNAEINEITGAGPSPYGNGTTANSPIIALGESWAYHMGHFMTDLKYHANSLGASEQQITYLNGPIMEGGFQVANTGLNAHLNLLEDFSPLRGDDPFRWIPQGLYYDLLDNRNDRNAVPRRIDLEDNVNVYTNAQFFNAFDPDVNTLPEYRIRLLNENGNIQAIDLTVIFNFYGY